MNTALADNNLVQAARYGSAIQADSNSELPTKIEVMRAGSWPETSNKGMLYITPDDLQEFVDNFHAGIGVPGGVAFGQIPIDFSHNDYAEAAGWITDLSVEGNILYATVTWTTAGEAALKGGMYKCFSPSFWPACLGDYPDPENWNNTAQNVLVGGGLTNIPFFKDLTAIMASNAGNSKDKQNNSNAPKENIVLTLDEVRIKEVASLTDDDKKVLADNKSELSADELKKYGLEEVAAAAVTADAKVEGVSDEDKAVLASIKAGETKVVKASEWNGMQDAVAKLTADKEKHEEAEITAFVTAQASEGKIKADAIDKWVGYIKVNADMREALEALPVHASVAAEKGKDGGDNGMTAVEELRAKAQEAIKASREAGSELSIDKAYSQVRQSNPDLAKRYDEEIKTA